MKAQTKIESDFMYLSFQRIISLIFTSLFHSFVCYLKIEHQRYSQNLFENL